MSTISQDLLNLDARQATIAPSALLRLRRSSLDYSTYLQLVMQDMAQGRSPLQWGDEMEKRGALTIAKLCWQAADLAPDKLQERYQQSKESWNRCVTDHLQRCKQDFQKCKSVLPQEEILRIENQLREIERYKELDWYDLAEEALEQIHTLLQPGLSAKAQEREQLLSAKAQEREGVLARIEYVRQKLRIFQETLDTFPGGQDGYSVVSGVLEALEQQMKQPRVEQKNTENVLSMLDNLYDGAAFNVGVVNYLLKQFVQSPPPEPPEQPEQAAPAAEEVQPAVYPDVQSPDPLDLQRQQKSEELQQQGNQRRAVKDFKKAEQFFSQALQLWPSNSAAAKNYATLLRQQGQISEAINVLEDGVKHAQERLSFYNLLISYCTDAGQHDKDAGQPDSAVRQFDKARDYAQKALLLVGDARAEIGVLTSLVTLEIKAGEIGRAMEYIESILRLNPRNDYMRKKKEHLQAQLSGEGPLVDTVQFEEIRSDLFELSIDISPLIREDLELCEITKASPRILQSGDSALLASEAERLYQKANRLDRRQYHESADHFLQAAKLIVQASKDSEAATPNTQLLEHALNNYTGIMGDYFLWQGYLDSARDYYLENIRLYKRALPWHILMRIANYFQTFLSTEEQRRQLADVVPRTPASRPRTSPSSQESQEGVQQIIEKMGELKDTPRNPDQELARGLLELACMSDLITTYIVKALENSAQMRSYLLPLLETLSRQFSINFTSNEPGDIFRQLVQHRHFSIKRQESQLSKLVDSMGQKWNLEQAGEELTSFTNYQREWSATDRTFFAKVRDLARRGQQYFSSEGRFGEKEQLARSISHDVDTFRVDLEKNPTFLGKAYFARLVYQLKRLVEKEFQELRQVSLPKLMPSIARVDWLSNKKSVACHIDIANEGESTARDVKLRIVSAGGNHDDYIPDIRLHPVGSIFAHSDAKTCTIPVELTEKAISQAAADLLIELEYIDLDNSTKTTGPLSLRLSLRDEELFTPIKNPYRIGRPIVDSPMFIGRNEFVEELAQELTREDSTSAIVIYGQKRSGKTSILNNLRNSLKRLTAASLDGREIIPVYISMQSCLGASEEEKNLIVPTMFYTIADEISRACNKIDPQEVEELSPERKNSIPTLQFRRYLDRIRRLPDTRLILLIDEFTELSDKIDQGYISPDIMKQLKSLIEQGFFSCVICGVDTMPDVLKKYANQLAVSDPRIVGYLSREAAYKLIEDPIRLPDGRSRFASPGVVDELIQLTAGSPYYIQYLCDRLVDHMNTRARKSTITRADLNNVLTYLITGTGPGTLDPYTMFDNLTRYKDDEKKDTYETVVEGLFLYLLAAETRTRPFAPFQAIRQQAPFVDEVKLLEVAEHLESRQVIERSVGETSPGSETSRQYRIVVDLFRRWINAKRQMDHEMMSKFREQLAKANV